MLRQAASRIAWVGRTTSMIFGLAIALALILGAGTAALAAVPGDPFKLGRTNAINALTQLTGTANNALLRIDNASDATNATALELETDPQRPPLRVNSTTKVAKLNVDKLDGKDSVAFLDADGKAKDAARADFADFAGTAQNAQVASDSAKLDGKDANEIGVNGLERVFASSDSNSQSGKLATARCPAGKVVVSAGYDFNGGTVGDLPNIESNLAVLELIPRTETVSVLGFEEEPISSDWTLSAIALCAAAP